MTDKTKNADTDSTEHTGQTVADTNITEPNLTEMAIPKKVKKQLVTVYVPVDILNEARARGINISRAATDGLILSIKCDKGYKQIFDKFDLLNILGTETKSGIININISEDAKTGAVNIEIPDDNEPAEEQK